MTTTQTRERGILFSGPMVRAILEGRKTQTRRLVKPQPDLLYRLESDRIMVCRTEWETIYEVDAQGNPRRTERRLPGGFGWADLLTDKVRGLWAQGAHGLVSAKGPLGNKKGQAYLLERVPLPREQQGHEVGASLGVHGLPRPAANTPVPSAPPGRGHLEQQAYKSPVGHAGRELGGQTRARHGDGGREALGVEADGRGAGAFAVGIEEPPMQPAPRRLDSWSDAGFNLRHCPFVIGTRLWVRETFFVNHMKYDGGPLPKEYPAADFADVVRDGPCNGWVHYRADEGEEEALKYGAEGMPIGWRPSLFMPRWASRITLEITDVRVERVEDISEDDATAEGVPKWGEPNWRNFPGKENGPRQQFLHLFYDINKRAKRGENPWVWVVGFKKVEAAQ